MTDRIFNSFHRDLANNDIDLGADTFNLMLMTSDYTPDVDDHSTRADITDEVVGTGYTAGGKALTGVTVTQDNDNDLVEFGADDVTWATATITARRGVLYQSNGGAASGDRLVKVYDFGGDKVRTAEDFTVQFSGGVILQYREAD